MGDIAEVATAYRGTRPGRLMTPAAGSLPAPGQQASAPFSTALEVVGGVITSHRRCADLARFMAQLTG